MIERELGSGLREVVHQRVRLGILAVLDHEGQCTFSQLRDVLGQSDGGMGRHLGVLEEHGYVATEKVFENRRPRTWIRMTEAGVEAFREEQELLAKLLASASRNGGGEDDTAAMAIVFAALLAGDDPADDKPSERTDRSSLVPAAPVIAGRRAKPIGSGPITAQYEFPDYYADFGSSQREQRLMLRSHGLRGGWVATWRGGDVTAQVMVVELASAADCASILAIMGPSTADLPTVPDARAYLLPGATDDASPLGVAWFSSGPYLVSIVVTAAADIAVAILDQLAAETRERLSDKES